MVKVKKGEPVTLVITRKTDKTCATEIVIDEDQHASCRWKPSTVTFTPRGGDIEYGCAMRKIVGGVLKVEERGWPGPRPRPAAAAADLHIPERA